MTQPRTAPYGSWQSPVTSELIVAGTVGLGATALDGDDIYWLELRATEGGRAVIVRRAPDGTTSDVNPAPFNARTRVHEYGGGSFTVANGVVYFSNFADQRLYRVTPGAEPRPITPEGQMRYADGVVDTRRNRMICVREDHSGGGEAVNTLVSVALDGDPTGGTVLVAGNDFYAAPRLSPDGSRLAWITWNHPNMPWDGTELWTAEVQPDGALANHTRVAGGPRESVVQPLWSPDGVLHFISDRSDWWNLYRLRGDQAEPLHPMEAEFSGPMWVFDISTYAFTAPERIVCAYTSMGIWHLAQLNTASGALSALDLPYTSIGAVQANSNGNVVCVGGSPTELRAVVQLDLATGRADVLKRAGNVLVDAGYLSRPEPIEFPTEHGQTAFGLFYPPKNRDYTAPEGEKPPLLVMIHGGPTSATESFLKLSIQYWTSRGIAVLDVNYGGSTGYGRAYRERLFGEWGIVDVDDCVNGARYLVERGLVDGDRLMITGGSAGGYTTLAVLTFRDAFKAGASHFGVSDIELLATDTHKFESRYMERLVGPYPAAREVFHARSPLYHTDQLDRPVIFFQGLDDKVVPPNQAEKMVEALRAKGLPVAYLPFEGEGHGFRRAENMRRSLDGELYFYSRIFGFPLGEAVEPVEIENL